MTVAPLKIPLPPDSDTDATEECTPEEVSAAPAPWATAAAAAAPCYWPAAGDECGPDHPARAIKKMVLSMQSAWAERRQCSLSCTSIVC